MIDVKKAKLQFDASVKPNPTISPSEFQTLLSIATLSDKDGVCRATRELINSKRPEPAKQIDTITRHTRKLALQPWFHTSYCRTGSSTLTQYLIQGVDKVLDQVLDHGNISSTYNRYTDEQEIVKYISPELSDSCVQSDPDGLPNGRLGTDNQGLRQEEKRANLFDLLTANTYPALYTAQLKELLQQHHEKNMWKAYNWARGKLAIPAGEPVPDGQKGKFNVLFQAHLEKIPYMVSRGGYLCESCGHESKPRSASNQAGANKPPRSGQKSQETAQISSQGHSNNEARQADQSKGVKDAFADSLEFKKLMREMGETY